MSVINWGTLGCPTIANYDEIHIIYMWGVVQIDTEDEENSKAIAGWFSKEVAVKHAEFYQEIYSDKNHLIHVAVRSEK